ncbi:MAG: hypothetical protein E2P02_11770 [Acidobacteria bacterium]|nr:MAG: hypothetical protein E2P02_11770 [Acidobacteriota bacterium]
MLDALVTTFDRAAGLTSFRSGEERIRRYFAEPLAAVDGVPERGLAIDIGSGGGSPALPMAIARPRLEWVLVEANGRKAIFLEEAVRTLGLERVRVHRGRYEAMESLKSINLVTCRAVKLESKTRSRIVSSLSAGGRFLWFGAEKRLESARSDLTLYEELNVHLPRPLLETNPTLTVTGWLLVTEKRPGPPFSPNCFT